MTSTEEKTNRVGIHTDSVLFFDLDGTLVETDYANFLAYKKAIMLVEGADAQVAYDSAKRFDRSSLTKALPGLSETSIARIIEEKEKCYEEFLSETRMNPKVADILCRYAGTNPTVLVSNCRRARALATLDYHGLKNKFSDLFFRQTENPYANKFRYAIAELNISPRCIVAFENDLDEISNAIRAGIRRINPLIL